MANSVILNLMSKSGLSDFIKVVQSPIFSSSTVWTNVQEVNLVAPVVDGYKFLVWINMTTTGSAENGYITAPWLETTKAYLPHLTSQVKVYATALYVKDVAI